ncbi:MAG: hypothetical protein ACTHL8_02400 [Burkholderiaceae bacterium]
MPRRRPALALLAAFAATAAAGLVAVLAEREPAVAADMRAPAESQAPLALAPAAGPEATVATAAAAPAARRTAAASPVRARSLAARIDRLSRSADPVDAFAAYRLVTDCLWARGHEAWMDSHIAPGDRGQLPTAQAACGDIASDQVQSRLQWLQRAALAGVHHAATAMAREGPDGLGLEDGELDAPQNADFRARLDAAWDAGVRTCDAESLEQRENAYETGAGVARDRARALSYWIAWVDCRRRAAGPGAGDMTPLDADAIARRVGRSLTPEQLADATAAGARMASDARPLPGDR